MRTTKLLSHALATVMLAGFSAACGGSDGGNDLETDGSGTDTVIDSGPPSCVDTGCEAGEVCNESTGMCETDTPPTCVDTGCDEGETCNETTGMCEAQTNCRIDQIDCPSGEVCNLITGQCEAGVTCDDDDDCGECDGTEACGHGFNLTSYCDAGHGNVCTRIRASCETCETDADCGSAFPDFGGFPSVCIEDPNGEEGRRVCARRADFGCPNGFISTTVPEAPGNNYCVNPQGCPVDNELFFCPALDANMDGIAENNPDCAIEDAQTSVCNGEQCPGTGRQRCTVFGFGIPPICNEFCLSGDDCPSNRPFCNVNTGVCSTGCTPGACPAGRVCNLDGQCGLPCKTPDNTVQEADDFCTDEFGQEFGAVYCNQNTQGRQLPTPFKQYRDENSCAPQGCEVQPGDQANRDCEPNFACDESLLIPDCVPGCFTERDCQGQGAETRICANASEQDVTSPSGDEIESFGLCRSQERFSSDSDNREVLGTCCNPGCIADSSCGFNEFCCGEQLVDRSGPDPQPGSVFGDASRCRTLTPISGVVAQAGQCFEAPLAPFCTTGCDPMDSFNTCNNTEVGNVVTMPSLGYDPNQVWPAGRNTNPDDMAQANNGQPFTELQTCVQVPELNPPAMPTLATTMCTVSFDRNSADTNAPRGWFCGAQTTPCFEDADCGDGLTCLGDDRFDMMGNELPGACLCGEDGNITVACPQDGGAGDAEWGGRNRCIEVAPENYLSSVPSNENESFGTGDFACVWSYTCAPPPFQAGDPNSFPPVPPTYGASCQANF